MDLLNFRVHLPDGASGRVVECWFDLTRRHVEIRIDKEDCLDVGLAEDGRLWFSLGYPCEETAGGDPIGQLARLANIGRNEAEGVLRVFLSEVLDVESSDAIARYHLDTLPVLRDLQKTHPLMSIPTHFDERLHRALGAPNPRLAAASFWAEEQVGAQATQAFMSCIVDDGRISTRRAAWLGLVPSVHRHELVETPLQQVDWLQPLLEWRAVLEELKPVTCVQFVKYAMSQPKSPAVLASAFELGLKVTCRDHVRAFNDLQTEVLRAGFGRPGNLAQFIVASGVAGEKASIIATPQDCVVAAKTLDNCWNSTIQPYKNAILSGRLNALAVGEDWDKAAVTIDPKTNRIQQKLGQSNHPLPDEIDAALQELERTWVEQVLKKAGRQHV